MVQLFWPGNSSEATGRQLVCGEKEKQSERNPRHWARSGREPEEEEEKEEEKSRAHLCFGSFSLSLASLTSLKLKLAASRL